MTTGAEAFAAVLTQAGIDTVFGLPGAHNLALWPALRAAGVRVVGVRHEQAAAYAADGAARSTASPAVALTTTGPGAANTVAAVGEAWASRSPVVVAATDIPTTLRRHGVYRGVLHECTDQASLFAAVTKEQVEVATAGEVAPGLAAALSAAVSAPRRPVYLGVPSDLLKATIDTSGAQDVGVQPPEAPAPEVVAAAAATLRGA